MRDSAISYLSMMRKHFATTTTTASPPPTRLFAEMMLDASIFLQSSDLSGDMSPGVHLVVQWMTREARTR